MLVTANQKNKAYVILSDGKPCAEIYFSLNELNGVLKCVGVFADVWNEGTPTATTIESSAQVSANVENELLLHVLKNAFPVCTGRNIKASVVAKFEKFIAALKPEDKTQDGARKIAWTMLMYSASLQPIRLGGIA